MNLDDFLDIVEADIDSMYEPDHDLDDDQDDSKGNSYDEEECEVPWLEEMGVTEEEYDAMDEQDQERLAFEYGYSFSADEEDDDILFDED